MESPIAIANYFIRKSIDSGREMTSMKLIKLVYISHGWYLALSGQPLIDESAEAWKYGPVVNSVYRETKRFGAGNISEMLGEEAPGEYPYPKSNEIRQFLDKIWELYGKYNGLQLSAMTHQAGTPWYITWNDKGGNKYKSVPISDELIKNHYTQKLNPVVNGSSPQSFQHAT